MRKYRHEDLNPSDMPEQSNVFDPSDKWVSANANTISAGYF
jgi:hypothetical protein